MMVRLESSGWPGDVSQDVNASEITPEVVDNPHHRVIRLRVWWGSGASLQV